jgi:hypothetical protein
MKIRGLFTQPQKASSKLSFAALAAKESFGI